MFYRIEARTNTSSAWEGIFHVLEEHCTRTAERGLAVPKWYRNHPNENSEAWFTEYGYRQFRDQIVAAVQEMNDWRRPEDQIVCRIRIADTLSGIVMSGRTQCIRRK